VQWYSFAGLAIVLWIVLNLRRVKASPMSEITRAARAAGARSC
jgi:hypothetical protein